MKKSAIITVLISLGVVLIPQIALADPIKLNIPIGSVKSVEDLGEYIRIFYEFFVTSAGVLAAAMIVIGGYKWITAMGNPSIISGAKEIILSAIFGLLLALTSYLILNAINPSITSLKPLIIPALDDLAVTGIAKTKCDFDTQLDLTDSTDPKPVRCGDTIIINTETGDKCVGRWNKDSDNFCKVVSSGGAVPMLSASEETEVKIQNHNITSQVTFDVRNDDGKNCGIVYWSFDQWRVGSKCPNISIPGGDDQAERCFMNGKWGDFESHPDYCNINYSANHEDGTRLEASQIKDGCGRLTNMLCAS